jgi:hypothetical protein
MAQRVNVRVHADTACKLFESCKLNPFVASVSAMGSPSGFLNFQGHNAVNGGHQYISMNFSYNINDSLAFSDVIHQSQYEELNGCDYKTNETQIHGFEVFFVIFSLNKIVLVIAVELFADLLLAMHNQIYYRDLTTS